ncbi:MAG: aminoacyl-tRNA hydrolase [Phycisphaerales bacterium]|nr:aminoacyl-tRNA hydrolase [Phycisphaerales bacterium]
MMIEISPMVGISEHELTFVCDRSPGPGGQNVNKVNTRVTLNFNVVSSTSLSSQQKRVVCQTLASRINSDGVLRVSSSKERTQLANRRSAVNRFVELMSEAFTQPKARKATRPTTASKIQRLTDKKKRGGVKSARSEKVNADD